jgi:hypothetical protein
MGGRNGDDTTRCRVDGDAALARQAYLAYLGRDVVQVFAQQRAFTREGRHLPGFDAQVIPANCGKYTAPTADPACASSPGPRATAMARLPLFAE